MVRARVGVRASVGLVLGLVTVRVRARAGVRVRLGLALGLAQG